MDYIALQQAILNNPDCVPYAVMNSAPKDPDYQAKDAAIADILNTPVGTRLVERYENAIGLMNALGAITGATILEKLDQAKEDIPALKWVMYRITLAKGVNIGDPETQQMLTELAINNVLTVEEAELVKNLAVAPSSIAYQTVGQPVTAADVSIALRNY